MSDPFTDDFNREVRDLVHQFKVPSIAIAIVSGDKTFANAYGTAVFPDVPATPSTLYYTGSTTKSFTAASLIQLEETSRASEHPLTLKDPLRKHIAGLSFSSDLATHLTTVEDALSHRSGQPAHNLVYGPGEYSIDDLIRAMPFIPFTAGPRDKYMYNNIMYMLASHVIEVVSGMSAAVYFKTRLWDPLGMSSTHLSLAEAQRDAADNGKVLARAYSSIPTDSGFNEIPYMDTPVIAGAGNTISTVLDYAKYLRAMAQDGLPMQPSSQAELRSPRSVTEAHAPSPFAGPRLYTLGWETSVYRNVQVYQHLGGLRGFGASMMYAPERDWGVVMLCNTDMRSHKLFQVLTERLLDGLLDVPADKRLDHTTECLGEIDKIRERWLDSKSRLYPDISNHSLPRCLKLESYAGKYSHPAYRKLKLELRQAKFPNAGGEDALTADMLDRTWAMTLQFEHISSEHFIAWGLPPSGEAPTLVGLEAYTAEFRVSAAGKVVELGIAFEADMGGEKIWFQRLD